MTNLATPEATSLLQQYSQHHPGLTLSHLKCGLSTGYKNTWVSSAPSASATRTISSTAPALTPSPGCCSRGAAGVACDGRACLGSRPRPARAAKHLRPLAMTASRASTRVFSMHGRMKRVVATFNFWVAGGQERSEGGG